MRYRDIARYAHYVLTDAHLHFLDLAEHDAAIASRYRNAGILAVTSCHELAEYERTCALMEGSAPYLVSFGIHPQLAIMTEADTLERLCASRSIAAIGECGFDFFGNEPRLERTRGNEKTQREAFEFQLELARRYDLPVVLHMRKSLDLLFEYLSALAPLKAVVFHSWGGPANEAEAIFARGVRAFFSFGASILNGNRKARETCARLPPNALLIETDAPWQPPRTSPVPHSPLLRLYSDIADIACVRDEAAILRGIPPEAVEEICYRNFTQVFGHEV